MWSVILLFIIGVLLFTFLVFDYLKKSHLDNLGATLRGPLALPIIGNAHLVVGTNSTGKFPNTCG